MRHFVRAHIVYKTGAATHLVEVDEKGVPLDFTAVCGAKMSHPKQIWEVGGEDPLTCPKCNRAPVVSDLALANMSLEIEVKRGAREREILHRLIRVCLFGIGGVSSAEKLELQRWMDNHGWTDASKRLFRSDAQGRSDG